MSVITLVLFLLNILYSCAVITQDLTAVGAHLAGPGFDNGGRGILQLLTEVVGNVIHDGYATSLCFDIASANNFTRIRPQLIFRFPGRRRYCSLQLRRQIFPYVVIDRDEVDRAVVVDCGEIANVIVEDRKSTRLNSSHVRTSYAVFCLKK